MKFVILGRLPSMNEIVKESKRYKTAYNEMKQTATTLVKFSCQRLPIIRKKANFKITYYEKNRKRDPDNVAAAKKFIFDGLVAAKKLSNDGWQQIGGWHEEFKVDKKNPRIEVEIEEV